MPSLQPAQHQVLDGVGSSAHPAGERPSLRQHLFLGEGFQEPQHLHVLPLAPPAHAGLQEPTQGAELLW